MNCFPKNFTEAKILQNEIAKKVVLKDFNAPIKTICGMDVSNTPRDPNKMLFGAAVVLSFPSLEILEIATHAEKQHFPYVPGYLSFREAPPLIQAFKQLKHRPDILLVDGQGYSHPRGVGLASHLGVLLDIPTIGVAKSLLVGKPDETLPQEPGKVVSLIWEDKEVAFMLRSKKNSAPLIISAGHLTSLKDAFQLVSKCLKGYRLPEPIRQAHLAANQRRLKS